MTKQRLKILDRRTAAIFSFTMQAELVPLNNVRIPEITEYFRNAQCRKYEKVKHS